MNMYFKNHLQKTANFSHGVRLEYHFTFKGILGESSAKPTSSSTTTDTYLSRSFLCWKLLHCLKIPTMPSGVDKGLHWKDDI